MRGYVEREAWARIWKAFDNTGRRTQARAERGRGSHGYSQGVIDGRREVTEKYSEYAENKAKLCQRGSLRGLAKDRERKRLLSSYPKTSAFSAYKVINI